MPDFFQNGISNLVLNFYRVYQRIDKISEMNMRPIRASRMELQKGVMKISSKYKLEKIFDF